jgi:hypothetical protein
VKLLEHYHPVLKHRAPDRHTLKIRLLLNEMREWIFKHNASLLRISEQAFETLHSSYLKFSANFQISETGALKRSGSRSKKVRKDADDAFGSLGPTGGTRSGAVRVRHQQGQAARLSRKLSLAIVSLAQLRQHREARSFDTGQWEPGARAVAKLTGLQKRTVVAGRKRFLSMVAFNATRLPRDRFAASLISACDDWERTDRSAPPPWDTPETVRNVFYNRMFFFA